jgi:hypothetical protein
VRRLRRRLRAAEARVAELEATLAEVYEAQRILDWARLRAAGEHLRPVPDDD